MATTMEQDSQALNTAFAEGDRRTLKNLLSREVYEGFEGAIRERESKGEKAETRFVSIDKSDVIGAELRGILSAIDLSRATMRNVYQNLIGAFVYNVLGLPVALGVLYPFFGILLSPLLAALAMSFSSVTVVTNANRLKRWRMA